MRRTLQAGLLLTLVALGGCHHRPPPQPLRATYTLGAAWQGAGSWFYPADATFYDATGIAAIDPAQRPRLTADGEAYSPDALAGAHQTLQLPVIVRVENLENGRTIALRLNDRGPAQPGRLLSLTPRAAAELGMAGLPRRVRVTLDQAASAQLLQQVKGAPAPDVTAAPLADVAEQSLMPGAPSAPRSPGPARLDAAPAVGIAGRTGRLPDQAPDPGQLWIDAGQFSGRRIAQRVAAATGGFVRQQGVGRSTIFLVRIGPLADTAVADATLDRVLVGGVTGARIVVE